MRKLLVAHFFNCLCIKMYTAVTSAMRHEHILSFVFVTNQTLFLFVVCLLFLVITEAYFVFFVFWAGMHRQLQKHQGLAWPV